MVMRKEVGSSDGNHLCFFRKVKKRGISAVVATVLIILITVAAVSIIWMGVLPIINGRLDKGTLCLDAMGQIAVGDDVRYTCWNNVSGSENVSLEIIRKAEDFDLVDVQVLVSAGGNVKGFSLIDSATTLSPTSITTGDLPGANEVRIFVVDVSSVSGDIDEVSIAPVMSNGNLKETCGVLSTVKIKKCLS